MVDEDINGLMGKARATLMESKSTGAAPALEAAIGGFARALRLLPDDNPQAVVCLSNLGVCLALRYSQTRDVADMLEATASGRRAAQLLA